MAKVPFSKLQASVIVSDYLTNHKIPYLQRKTTLVLCNSENVPLAILGYVVK